MSIDNTVRGEAWVGDAVLALYARRWLLRHTTKKMSDADRQQLFELFVSNQFLSSFGEPSQRRQRIENVHQYLRLASALRFCSRRYSCATQREC
jgi:hypothetical protein